jgi:hypothetical protein
MSDIARTARGAANDPAAPVGALARCISILMHLSLSLSLLAGLAGF